MNPHFINEPSQGALFTKAFVCVVKWKNVLDFGAKWKNVALVKKCCFCLLVLLYMAFLLLFGPLQFMCILVFSGTTWVRNCFSVYGSGRATELLVQLRFVIH